MKTCRKQFETDIKLIKNNTKVNGNQITGEHVADIFSCSAIRYTCAIGSKLGF